MKLSKIILLLGIHLPSVQTVSQFFQFFGQRAKLAERHVRRRRTTSVGTFHCTLHHFSDFDEVKKEEYTDGIGILRTENKKKKKKCVIKIPRE